MKKTDLIKGKIRPHVKRMLNKYHYLVKKHRKAIREGVENMIQHINKSLIAGTEMQKTINQNKENNSW